MSDREFQSICRTVELAISEHYKVGEITKYEIGSRMTSTSGSCFKHNISGRFNIKISKHVLDKNSLIDTIAHEIVHTIEGCFNHGFKFKMVANHLNMMLNTNISVHADERAKKESKYIIKCKDCGQEVYRDRMCKLVKGYEHYRCGICDGKLDRIK